MRAFSSSSGVWEATPTWYTVVIIVVNGSAVFKRFVSRCVYVICLLLSREKKIEHRFRMTSTPVFWKWKPYVTGFSVLFLSTSSPLPEIYDLNVDHDCSFTRHSDLILKAIISQDAFVTETYVG